jgi:predicted RNA-binding protein with PUA-like domain
MQVPRYNAGMRYWLMKSEPSSYSIDDLARDGATAWDSIRNYQARNFMRDDMRPGDRVLFYHSNANPPGVAGIAEITSTGYPDHTARDAADPYYDPAATETDPRWFMVDVKFAAKFDDLVSLPQMKADARLNGMLVTGKSRLSVQPVEQRHFQHVLQLAGLTLS